MLKMSLNPNHASIYARRKLYLQSFCNSVIVALKRGFLMAVHVCVCRSFVRHRFWAENVSGMQWYWITDWFVNVTNHSHTVLSSVDDDITSIYLFFVSLKRNLHWLFFIILTALTWAYVLLA